MAVSRSGKTVTDDASIIAIVDDHAGVRTVMAMLVEANGWKSRTYCSGEDLLNVMLSTQYIDCVVLDLNLEGMNGAEGLERLSEQDTHVPVIILTSEPDSRLARRAMRFGARVVIDKMDAESELVPAIKDAIERGVATK